jgi:hypothetical protein
LGPSLVRGGRSLSPDYFKLIDQHGKDVAKYLNSDEPVTVELGGQAYSF